MMAVLSCAIRGRSKGPWHSSEHRQHLEIGNEVAYSITSVQKDSLILEYEEEMCKIKKDMDKIEKDSFLPEELKGKKFRIRKLTPREVFRLMDVDDADIDKIQAYPYESLVEHPAYSKEERFRGMTEKEKRAAMKNSISNSAQYKLAGNSIVVNVLYHIFRKMFIETGPETTTQPQQLSLF